MNRCRISSGQLIVLLLASRLSHGLLLPSDSVAGLSITWRVVATLISGALLFLLALPTALALRGGSDGLIDIAYRRSRLYGKMVCGGYAVLCLFILGVDVLQFCDFAEKAMPSGFSVGALAIALIAVSFIASFYGMQALARTALPVAVFAVVSLCVLGLALLPEMRTWYFPIHTETTLRECITAVLRDIPRTAEIAVLGMLYPYTRSARVRTAAAVSGGVTAMTLPVCATALGVLGDFVYQTAYPYYTAVTAAEIGVFERPDIVVTAVWLGTFFVRMTLFCFLFTTAIRRLLGNTARRVAAGIGAAVLSLVAVITARGWSAGNGLAFLYGAVLLVFCVGLPVALRRRSP